VSRTLAVSSSASLRAMANSPRANHASLNPRRANILDRPEQHRFTPLVQDHLEPQPGRVVLSRRKLGELLRDSQLNLHLGGEPGDPASVSSLRSPAFRGHRTRASSARERCTGVRRAIPRLRRALLGLLPDNETARRGQYGSQAHLLAFQSAGNAKAMICPTPEQILHTCLRLAGDFSRQMSRRCARSLRHRP